jgi:predicted transcriptional regulator
LSGAIQREKDKITAGFSSFIGSLSAGVDGLSGAIARTKSIIASTKDAINNFVFTGQEAQVRTDARQRLTDIARGKTLPDEKVIQKAISEATQFNQEDFTSAFELQKAQSLTRNDLVDIKGSAEEQLTGQERSQQIVEAWKAEYEAQEKAQLDALDAQLSAAQAQLDALNGINTSVQSVQQAMTEFAAAVRSAMTAAGAVPGAAGGGTSSINTGMPAGSKTPFNIDWWENTAVDFSKNPLAAPVTVVAPALVMADGTNQNMQGVERRLDSLEQVMTTSMMNLIDHSKTTADTLEQFNLQGMPAER